MTFSGTLLRLDHLLLLHMQAMKIFYSPDPAEAADSVRQMVNLSSHILENPEVHSSNQGYDNENLVGEGSDGVELGLEQKEASLCR